MEAASENASVGKLLRELREPRPAGLDCIPWLGETAMKERILRLVAKGKIAINLRGLEYLQSTSRAKMRSLPGNACVRSSPTRAVNSTKSHLCSLLRCPTTGGTPQPTAPPAAGEVSRLVRRERAGPSAFPFRPGFRWAALHRPPGLRSSEEASQRLESKCAFRSQIRPLHP